MTLQLPIYMDYHATTPLDPRVLETMLPYFRNEFGNAASRNHQYGWTAEAEWKAAIFSGRRWRRRGAGLDALQLPLQRRAHRPAQALRRRRARTPAPGPLTERPFGRIDACRSCVEWPFGKPEG